MSSRNSLLMKAFFWMAGQFTCNVVIYYLIVFELRSWILKFHDADGFIKFSTFGTAYFIIGGTIVYNFQAVRHSLLVYAAFILHIPVSAAALIFLIPTRVHEIAVSYLTVAIISLLLAAVIRFNKEKPGYRLPNVAIGIAIAFAILVAVVACVIYPFDKSWKSYLVAVLFSVIGVIFTSVSARKIVESEEFDPATDSSVTLALLTNLEFVQCIFIITGLSKGSMPKSSASANAPPVIIVCSCTRDLHQPPSQSPSPPSVPETSPCPCMTGVQPPLPGLTIPCPYGIHPSPTPTATPPTTAQSNVRVLFVH